MEINIVLSYAPRKLPSPMGTSVEQVTRHPLDRLVSAYGDKYLGGRAHPREEPFATMARKVLGLPRDQPVLLSFQQFLRIVMRDFKVRYFHFS